ncbi:MAG: ATP-grasp domain-containing protein [Clostridia bacterium]
MNFIFISPNYPDFFYKFCASLKNKGAQVFGIGDSPFILNELRSSVTEYFFVPNMKDFSALCAVTDNIVQKYGKIDGIDSLNEFWLETESNLRQKYNVTGAYGELMQDYKFKSRMKNRFAKANVPTAPWVKSANKLDILSFATAQGFPLFCKPDNGVGADDTHKFGTATQLATFLENNDFSKFIFEPYVDGDIFSFDGLCDKNGKIVFCACHQFYTQIDKLKQSGEECIYRTLTDVPPALYTAGLATVNAFELKNSFFHIEFFKLTSPLKDIAQVGSYVALEVNMRIAGGYTAEMLYHALGIDIYALWASVVCGETPNIEAFTFAPNKRTSINIGRKIGHCYKYLPAQLKQAFPQEFILYAETAKEENPFGNFEIIATFSDENRLNAFIAMALEKA